MPCEPAPPCEPTFPVFCDPLPTTTSATRVVVEDLASCQKTIATTPIPSILKSTSTGLVNWEGGSTGSVLSLTTANSVDFVTGSSSEPLQLPALDIHTIDTVPNVIVMLADGTVKKWDPTNVGNNFLAYWDGSDWRINTLNGLLPSGNGTVFIRDGSGNLQAIGGNNNDILQIIGNTPTFVTSSSSSPFPAGHLYGLVLSNNLTNPNTAIDVSAGECRDSTASNNIVLTSSFTKTVTGAFVAGTGVSGLVGGTPVPGPNATLHVLIIQGASGVDIGFHANPTIALGSLPAGYNQFYRRIGSILTDGAGSIEQFFQSGDRFLLKTPFKSASTRGVTVTTTGTTISLYVPSGIRVNPLIRGVNGNPTGLPGGTGAYWMFYQLDQGLTSLAMNIATPTTAQFIAEYSNVYTYMIVRNEEFILTNTSRQIGVLAGTLTGNINNFNWDIWGWIDQRNRLEP